MCAERQVLIVEDDADTRETLEEIFRDSGVCAAGAANGLEALTYLRSHPGTPVILLDLVMPVMDGWRFRTEQQQDPQLASIPVVIVSGMDDLPRETARLHADGYMDKPYNVDHLLQLVRRYC